jgi:sirohydrochlorin ferrochelatase
MRRVLLNIFSKCFARRQLMMGLRLGSPRPKVAAGVGFSDFWRLVWAQPAVYLDQPLAVCAATTRIFQDSSQEARPLFCKSFL